MIEKTVLNYLKNVLDVSCFMEFPQNKPKTFVVIEKTSGARSNFINSATFAIQSYDETLYKTAELNEEVKKAMIGDGVTNYGITSQTDISKCTLNSDYNHTDTQNKTYRYQAVFDIIY